MKNLMESLGAHRHRAPRPPLRTLQEMAEELGVEHRYLGKIMKSDPSAPTPEINNNKRCVASKVQWFNPAAVRRWWASKR